MLADIVVPRLPSPFRVLITVSTVLSGVLAQGGLAWHQLAPPNSPSPRQLHAMAYDWPRDIVVLFGGENLVGNPLNDTWEWNGSQWFQQTPPIRPTARARHKMAYHAASSRVVLFGGGTSSAPLADTWTWDGTIWSQRQPVAVPSARINHAMVSDIARQRLVLFGGGGGGGLSDTWEWDGANWLLQSPVVSPPGRGHSAMAYDLSRQVSVLFGGTGGLGDTWEWDGTSWTQRLPATNPSPRKMHRMAWDADRARVILHGGTDTQGGLSDLWEWDGTDWTMRSTASNPSTRARHSLVYETSRHRTMLFGGGNTLYVQINTLYGDTWSCASVTPASFTRYGVGCPGSAGVPLLDASQFELPWIGDTFSASMTNLPAGSLAFVSLGFVQMSTSIPLLPGCTQLHSADIALALSTVGGVATFSSTLPMNPAFAGFQYFVQGAVMNAGGNNALGAALSNGGQVTIGVR